MASDARAFLAAVRFQLELMRGNPDYWLVLVTTPFFLVIFLGIVRHAGRADLTAVAVPAPVLIALWSMCSWWRRPASASTWSRTIPWPSRSGWWRRRSP